MKKTYRWFGPGDVGECGDGMSGLELMLCGLRPMSQEYQAPILLEITIGKNEKENQENNIRIMRMINE